MDEEARRVNSMAEKATYAAGPNAHMVAYSFDIFSRYIRGTTVLELGPAEGLMTGMFAASGLTLTLVEGGAQFCRSLVERFPRATVHNCLFESFSPSQKFDNIAMGHVLEHVEDPVAIVERAKQWLTERGRILAAVPNCRSLHRQAAVLMGLLPYEEALNEADLRHGHRRVFSPESFRRVFLEAGMRIEVFGGYWLKPVSNTQIDENWSLDMLRAFMALGERYPDIAAEMYIVATP